MSAGPSDEELMQMLQRGDAAALGTIYERHAEKVWSYISKRLPKEAAEDLFQDCFVKLVEKKDSWKNQPFLLWLYVVLRNLVTDYHRSHQVEKKYLEKLAPADEPIGNSEDFQELVRNMSPETSKLLTEFFKEGWSYKELAARYEQTEVSLRKRPSLLISNSMSWKMKWLHYFRPCRDLLLSRRSIAAVLSSRMWRSARVFWPSFY